MTIPEAIQRIALDLAWELRLESATRLVTKALVACEAVALARLWLTGPDGLRLVASAGAPQEPGADWSRLDGAFARVPLAQVKEVKNRYGATVNDVLLATCALAMRRYLEDRKGLPPNRSSRRARCRYETTTSAASGNRLSVCSQLHTVCDPIECLLATRRLRPRQRSEHEILGPETLGAWAELADPLPAAWPAISTATTWLHLLDPELHPVEHPGAAPPSTWRRRDGAGLSVGPCSRRLNVTMMSYRDSVDFGPWGPPAGSRHLDLADAVPAPDGSPLHRDDPGLPPPVLGFVARNGTVLI
jgi:hypothetical protein